MVNKKTRGVSFAPTRLSLCVVTALAAIGSAPAWAFEFDTGNPDTKLRWDNTVRYNSAWRMEAINPAFANAYGYDESETRFKKNDMIMNRLDLLSELDYTFHNNYGFRVSAAIWSENGYPGTTHIGDSVPAAQRAFTSYGAGPISPYSAYTKRYVTGSSGEFLDAFVYSTFEIGSTELSLKLGQHNIYWGESVFNPNDSVAAGQGPSDGIKALTSPGIEAKETSLPINQLSGRWTLSPEVALIGQYLLDWKPTRITPGGTYFAAADGAGNSWAAGSPVCTAANTTCTPYLGPITPGRNGGDFGLAVRWSPFWLNGNAGFYYRKYDEKVPWSVTQLSKAGAGSRYNFARDTELVGVSLNKVLGPVSAGFELSYRKNTALNSSPGFFSTNTGSGTLKDALAARAPTLNDVPSYEQAEGARGNTYHFIANGTWLAPATPLWDAATVLGEIAYQRLDKVTKNPALFYAVGTGYACGTGGLKAGLDATDGCATKDSWTMNLLFSPGWAQVMPGLDLSMPMTMSYGLKGNSPALSGAYEHGYKWAIGLTATYHSVYEFGVQLADQHQDYKTGASTTTTGVPGTQIFTTGQGTSPEQNNHRWLNVRFKTSF